MASDLLTAAQLCGITGDEHPLTPTDVPAVVAAAYSPWEAAAVLSGKPRRDSQRGSGSSLMTSVTDRQGIHVRLHTGPPRAGLIAWSVAERTIRDRAGAADARTLVAAVEAYGAHLRRFWPTTPGRCGRAATDAEWAEGSRLVTAMDAAWRAVMADRPQEPEQLDLFAEVA